MKKVWKILVLTICAAVLCGCVGALVFLRNMQKSEEYVQFDTERLNQVCSTITILDDSGQEIQEAICYNNNKQIPLSALHDYTYKAFVAVEDKRFYQHNGIDFRRVLGALARNLKSRSFKEGASTISQQLIKNTHLNNSKTIKRKINEMLLALELEKNYSKAEILEMYLNTIYFGRSAYGIESAANVYFDKSAAELTIAESATLAGMIKAPNNYAPDKNVEKCLKRRNLVLQLMLEQQIISENDYNEATITEIVFRPYNTKQQNTYVSMVMDEACKLLNMTHSQLLHSGFVIETCYNEGIQKAISTAANNDTTLNTDGTLSDLSCLVCKNDGGVVGCYFRGTTCNTKRQIGSTAKPFAVYTPALCEKLITQASPVLDEPTTFGDYSPSNANGYCGWTTVKNAVAKSLNVPAVKTLNSLTIATAEKYLTKLGIDGQQNLSMALGNLEGGMNIHTLANCYATLANGGTSNGVYYVKGICNNHGKVYSRTPQETTVFSETAAYLMTDMLQNAVQNGTAAKLSTSGIYTAAKTGTVGNSNGNSDALVAGYTTEHCYVFWYSGMLPNSVNGATAPCELAAQTLSQMYNGKKPTNFKMPQCVEQITVDTEQLYKNQIVQVADSGEKFLFDVENKPSTVHNSNYNFELTTRTNNGKAEFCLPNVHNSQWKIYRICVQRDIEVNKTDVVPGKYYAQLMHNNTCVYTTPTIEILPNEQKRFWDFWVLPGFN